MALQMRDYNFIDDDGRRIPVAQMSYEDIRLTLRYPIVIVNREEYPGLSEHEAAQAVRRRLEIELLIRKQGMRG